MDRKILHVDINNCYASIECLYHPELVGKPVAVAGSVEDRHGIILAKNQIAKEFGVKTAEVIWQAKSKCPDLVVLKPHYDRYLEFSKKARLIYERYTDRIEPFGLDECWLDVTCTRRDITEVADEIRNAVKEELGITVSVGGSFNKIFAKLGSDMKKPDATTILSRENYKEKAWGLPVSDLLFIGRSNTKKLNAHGIFTIGNLAQTPVKSLQSYMGKWGLYIHQFANGVGNDYIALMGTEEKAVKSVSNGTTSYRDLENDDDVNILIFALAESVATRLRKLGLKSSGISLSIRDSKLRSYTKQRAMATPTDDGAIVAKIAFELYKNSYNWDDGIAIRSLSVGTYNLCSGDCVFQLDFFSDIKKIKKRENINEAVDKIRAKYGYTSINRAVVMGDRGFKSFDARLQNEIHPVGVF